MNRVTRNGIFETNSSSTHSIAIFRGGSPTDTLRPDKDGKVHVWPGEFGWDVVAYRDAESKASYALTWAKQYGKDEDVESLRRAIERHTGHDVVFESRRGECYEWGYIDHQSSDVCEPAFECWDDDYEALINFIFNPESVLITDNDNH